MLWPMRFAIVLVFALACGDDSSFDAGTDASEPIDARRPDATDASTADGLQLVVHAPSTSPAREYVPVLIELVDTASLRRDWRQQDANVHSQALSWRGLTSMTRGGGAEWIAVMHSGDVDYTMTVDGLSVSKTVELIDYPERALTGTLTDDDLRWTPEHLVRLSGTTTVAAGTTLIIEPGTHVRLDPRAVLDVEGDFVAGGAGEPVTIFATDRSDPFGMIHHRGDATYTNVFVSGGGAGDWTHAEFRHCCIPMVYAEGGTLTVERSLFFNSRAKGILTENTNVVIRGSVFYNLGFGTEHFNEAPHTVLIEDSSYSGMTGEDDNDGIYVWQQGSTEIRRTTISHVDDDGIDLESATPVMEDVLIEGAADKCVSVTNEGPTVRNAFFDGCRVGVKVDGTEAGSRFEGVTMVNLVEEGVRLSDREGSQPDAMILPVFERIILGAVPTPLRTDYDPLDATFSNSVLPAELGTSGSGNTVGAPELEDYVPHAGSPGATLNAGFRGW